MTVKALAPWFGGNRMLAENVGVALRGCDWVGIPFAGGMAEVPRIGSRTLLVNDLHRHVINLARVAADADLRPRLIERLSALLFHPDELAAAQMSCRLREDGSLTGKDCALWWAADYFVCCWMGRSGQAGTDSEFSGGLAVRWEAGGGDSNVRFRSAVAMLDEFGKSLQRCTFSTLDVFDFLARCKDRPGHGIYVDAPWPDDGDGYRYKFDEAGQRRLAGVLSAYTSARVVVRYGDHPLIRELYPESAWRWQALAGRTSANKAKAEVLIVRNF